MSCWTAAELARFLAHAADESPALIALWRTAATTGARRGELAGMKWADLDLDTGAWRVGRTRITNGSATILEFDPKTEAGNRIVALDEQTVSALRAHRRRQLQQRIALGAGWPDTGYVFVDALGEPLHPNRISAEFKRLARDGGLRVIQFHEIRHTAATLMMSAGENPEIVRQRIGHENVTTTLAMYTHALPEDQRRGADRLAALIESGS
jgi:integrase